MNNNSKTIKGVEIKVGLDLADTTDSIAQIVFSQSSINKRINIDSMDSNFLKGDTRTLYHYRGPKCKARLRKKRSIKMQLVDGLITNDFYKIPSFKPLTRFFYGVLTYPKRLRKVRKFKNKH